MKVFFMNIRKSWILAFVVVSVGEISYSGPLVKTVGTSVGVGTCSFAASFLAQAFSPLFGESNHPLQKAVELAGVDGIATGVAVGMVSAPVFAGLHAHDIRNNIENSKHHWIGRCNDRIRDAKYDMKAHSSSQLVKEKSRKDLIAFQLALHEIDAFDKTRTSSSAAFIGCDLLDDAPAILTVCGLVPAILCDCSLETIGTILTASYCSGGAALLYAKIQEHRWNPIAKQVENILVHGCKDENGKDIEISQDFIRMIDKRIASKHSKDKIKK